MSASPVTELLSRLRALDVKVWAEGDRLRVSAPRDVLTADLRGQLAAHKAELLELLSVPTPATQPTPAAGDGAVAPLSFAQQRLWFLDQLRPGSPEYNIPGATRLRGSLDHSALERAIAAIVERHDILRTRFMARDGVPMQVVDPFDGFRVDTHDLRDLPDADRDAVGLERMRADAARPFDLTRGPLLRATLYQLRDNEWLMLCVLHHIAGDGWSGSLFINELTQLYAAFVSGKPSPLPPLALQYADVARRQRIHLQGDVLERELAFWRTHLAGLPDALELPTDHPRPPIQTSNGAILKLDLPTGCMSDVESLSRREGVTPFMTLLAAFATVLARTAGQDDVAVGTPIANRTSVEVEPLIGYFANTLVMRTDVSGNPTFRELLHRVRESALGAYAHQDVPFEKIVEALQPAREMSRSPLFQVIFALQNLPQEVLQLPGVTLEPLVLHSGAAQAEISLHVVRDGAGHVLGFEYNTDLFDGSTVRALGERFIVFLRAAVRDPTARVLDLPLLADDERHRVLVEWNATDAPLPDAAGAHALILDRAARTPDAIAVACGDVRLSYGDLRARVLSLAAHLRGRGVRAGALVGVCVDRTPDMLVALLAILEAGGAYVPIDPAYPPDRVAMMLDDAECPVIVVHARTAAALPPHGAALVVLDDDQGSAAGEGHATAAAPRTGHDDVAYVIFTSGSTGRPKGVRVPHRALLNLLTSMARTPGVNANDRLLAVTTLSFDIAGLELFLPLFVGGRVVLASREAALDPAQLAMLIEREGITVMQATPATWRMLIEHGWRPPGGFRMLCGGEALPPELARALTADGAELWNVYGPTETTIWSTAHRVIAGEAPVPIGRPIANTYIYILDAQGAPTPIGVPGELHIGGTGVALGYLRRPDLTAERFVPDPFAAEGGARMYRTGDRARWRRDGTVEYHGRADTQVKIRGFRVELGEIETILTRHAAVAQAVVDVRRDAGGIATLAAYVVPSVEKTFTPPDLRAHLSAHLPEYMIPSTFTALAALPLTPNGKVDRKRLPAPAVVRTDRDAPIVAPRTDVERTVARVWGDALGVATVGATDNFFDLGGHSLMIVKVHGALRAELDHDLTIVEMFQYPTVRALADRIARGAAQGRNA